VKAWSILREKDETGSAQGTIEWACMVRLSSCAAIVRAFLLNLEGRKDAAIL